MGDLAAVSKAGGTGEVEVAGAAVTGEGDKAGFVEECVVGQYMCPADGEALAGVQGEGVAVVHAPGFEEVAGESDGGRVGSATDAGRPAGGVNADDCGAV